MRAYGVALLGETGLIPSERADCSQSLVVLSLNIYRFYYLLLGVKHVSPAAEMALVGSLGTAPMGLQSKRTQEFSQTGNENIFKIFRIAPLRALARA